MAIREVLKMGNPLLREFSQPVPENEMTGPELKALIADMFDTMEHEQGIGIAAPQIGVLKQVAIVGLPGGNPRYQEHEEEEADYEPLVVINPQIKPLTEEVDAHWEGCLSVPGLRGLVERPNKIQVEFFDPEGALHSLVAEGFVATIFQHEIDHLFGNLYVDRVKDPKNLSFNEEFEKYHLDSQEDE